MTASDWSIGRFSQKMRSDQRMSQRPLGTSDKRKDLAAMLAESKCNTLPTTWPTETAFKNLHHKKDSLVSFIFYESSTQSQTTVKRSIKYKLLSAIEIQSCVTCTKM